MLQMKPDQLKHELNCLNLLILGLDRYNNQLKNPDALVEAFCAESLDVLWEITQSIKENTKGEDDANSNT